MANDMNLMRVVLVFAFVVLCGCNVPPSSSRDFGAPDVIQPDIVADLPLPDGSAPDLGPLDLGAPDAAAGTPFGAATLGAYIMGSSYAEGIQDYLKTFIGESGITAKVASWTVGGAPINYLWTGTQASDPTLFLTKLTELKSGAYGLLFMNAQMPWIQTDMEIKGVSGFTAEALKAKADFRFLIQVYWRTEQSPYRFSETSTRRQDLAMYRRGALRVAYQVARAIKAPVFVAPVGTAVEGVKDLALAGKLVGFKTRAALHESDGEHLSDLGHYIQAMVVHTAAYQNAPQGHSRKLGSASGGPSLTTADAKLIWDEVSKAVRDTPFSGWYKKSAGSYTAYLAALKAAIRNWETFDKLTQLNTPGDGTFTGEDGLTWTYKQGMAVLASAEPRLFDRTLVLDKVGSSLWASIPGGVGELSFVFSKRLVTAADAVVELRVGGKTVGTYTRSAFNADTKYANQVTGIDGKGPVKLEFVCKGSSMFLDNVIWTEYPQSSSPPVL